MHIAPTLIDTDVRTAQEAIDAIAACGDVEARVHALDSIGAYVVQLMETSQQDLALLRVLNEVNT